MTNKIINHALEIIKEEVMASLIITDYECQRMIEEGDIPNFLWSDMEGYYKDGPYMMRELGLESHVNGEYEGFLFTSIMQILVDEGKVRKKKINNHNYYLSLNPQARRLG